MGNPVLSRRGHDDFYVLSYLRCPGRLLRLAKGIFQSRFQPRSLFEQRIYDFIVRARRTLFAKEA
jgi:hypothetical protein